MDIDAALETAHRQAVIEVIRSNPAMTLAELAKLGRSNGIGSITVGDILAGRATGARGPADPGAVDTSTVEARQVFDAAVLDALVAAGKWTGAADVRAAVGGSPLQTRKALARLIERGVVEWKGQARSTKYRARADAARRAREEPAKAGSKVVDTRTTSGRANYDQAVLATLTAQQRVMRAEAIRAAVGGTPNQLRASLKRLVDAKLVRSKGRARATEYSAL